MNIDSIFMGPFISMLHSGLSSLLYAIVPAMTVSTNLFTSGIYSVWSAVLLLSEALLSIAVILVAYTYFSNVPLHGYQGNEGTLARLIIAAIAMPFTLYLAQDALNLNDAMASFILPYGELSVFTQQVVSKLGGYSLGSLIILAAVTVLLYLVLIVRMLLVFFTASLLPLACLCTAVRYFRNFGMKLISLFLEFTFLTFFMAVAFRIGLSVSSSTFSSLQIPPLLIAGTYLLPLFVPVLLSPTGSRVMGYAGIFGVSAVTAAGLTAVATGGAYIAGLLSTPFSSIVLRRYLDNPADAKKAVHGRGYQRAFTTGHYHSTLLMHRAFEYIDSRKDIPTYVLHGQKRTIKNTLLRKMSPPHRIYRPRGMEDE
jgi:hypothetical protein